MASPSSTPVMTQTTPDDPRAGRHTSPAARYFYPRSPLIAHPPTAYVSPDRRRPSEAPRTDVTRVHSSISSAGSGYTDLSGLPQDEKSPLPTHTIEQVASASIPSGSRQSNRPSSRSSHHELPRHETSEHDAAVLRYLQQQQQLEAQPEKKHDHAEWVLCWLSLLDPIHSLVSAVYTLMVVLTLLLATPLRLCQTQSPPGHQMIRVLAPIFRHHLRMLHADSVDNAYHFDFSPGRLLLVHALAPVVSLGVMVATWVSAVFWLLDTIMGNPDGTEKGDDGRNTVLKVRDWFEAYLLHALRR